MNELSFTLCTLISHDDTSTIEDLLIFTQLVIIQDTSRILGEDHKETLEIPLAYYFHLSMKGQNDHFGGVCSS